MKIIKLLTVIALALPAVSYAKKKTRTLASAESGCGKIVSISTDEGNMAKVNIAVEGGRLLTLSRQVKNLKGSLTLLAFLHNKTVCLEAETATMIYK